MNPLDASTDDGRYGPRTRLATLTVGFAVTALLVVTFPSGIRLPPPFAPLGAYLVVWLPLVASVLVVRLAPSLRSGGDDRVRWRIRPIDLLWGAAIGLLLRIVVSILEILVYGSLPATSGGAVPLGSAAQIATFVLGFLAVTIIAPVIEEGFFRGALLPALIGSLGGRRWTPVVISAVAFAGLHLLTVSNAPQALVVGLGTFLVGLATAAVVVLTGRLGPALIAHVVFNTSILALGWTAVTGGTGVVIE